MKKICIAILLSFLIVISGGSLVFAEDYIDGGVNKDWSAPLLTNTVTYINTYESVVGNPMFFRLIPAMTDNYTIETIGTADTEGELYDASGVSLEVQDDVVGVNFKILRVLNGGATYFLRVINFDGIPGEQTTLRITGDTGGGLVSMEAAPTATVQAITGTLQVGATLTGHYTYSDVNGDLEGTSTYKWYRSDNAAGLNKAPIAGATSITYVLQSADAGKYISFEVTPAALTGITPGTAVESDRVGAVAAPAYGSFSFSSATYSVAENGGSVIITVNRTGGSDGAVTVSYAVSSITATFGNDYTVVAATLSFGNGETSKTFTVSILDDDVYEGDESFSLLLLNPGGGAVLGEPKIAFVTIIENEAVPIVNAAAPVITNDLSTSQVEYNQNAAATAFNATATAGDGGTLSYAWYSNTTNSTAGATPLGITTATYTPSTATAGTTYYYCVVTNTNNAVNGTTTAQTTSAIAKIKVNALVNAVAPVITSDLSTTQVEYNQNAAAAALDATATVSDGGIISYAWYSNTANSTVGATPLGVTTATYTPSTAAAGTTYYYCVVTNTNNAVSGTKTAQTTSAIANIKVNALVNAVAPVITSDLSTTQVEYNQNAAAAALDATATVSDGGTISYAWYSNTANSTVGATPLGVTTATYTPSTAAAGTTYYYCVVTNTNNAVSGTKIAQTTSAISNIKVNAPANAAQLAEALGGNAAASGNTVTLIDNIADVAATIQIAPIEDITLDLAGYSISGKTGSYMDAGITPLKIIGGTSTLTITGSGRILGGSVDIFSAADAISISGGTVVIENGSITGGVSNHGSGYQSCGDGIEISSGSLTIKGGAIKGGVDPAGYNYAGNGLNLSGGTVTIYDGNFYSGEDHWNNSKAIYATSATVADIIAAGKIMKSYTDEGFTTGEAIVANDTLLSELTSKYIRVQAPVVNAESPVITNDLSTTQVEYSQNVAATALNAIATVTDGGTISYEWYSNTTNSTVGATPLGVTTATYTPSTAAVGTAYYYCVVTNTNDGVNGTKTAQTTSAIANIKVNATGGGGGGGGHSSSTVSTTPVITVSEVKSELFSNAKDIKVEADVKSAFGQSVTVKLTDDADSKKEMFSLTGANDKVYPFDISLYSKNDNKKVQPKDGYSVKITLPLPEDLLGDREKIKVVYGKDGKLETLKSELTQKDGKWYITFEAIHFSPYALIVSAEPAQTWVNPFSDVKDGDWYYSAVQYAAQNGLMKGTGSNTFSPGVVTNRGMIATILYNLDGSKENAQSTFKDVSSSAYYANAVAWAQKEGIITGYGNGMFGPDDSITREQLAVMLWKYAGSPATVDSQGLASFKDAGEISTYAQNALTWANKAGIINGKGGALLDPQGQATRAETAQIFLNYLNAVK